MQTADCASTFETNHMLFGRGLKLLQFKLGLVIPVNLLSHKDVMVLDYNEHHGPEQCKGPDQDLRALLYLHKQLRSFPRAQTDPWDTKHAHARNVEISRQISPTILASSHARSVRHFSATVALIINRRLMISTAPRWKTHVVRRVVAASVVSVSLSVSWTFQDQTVHMVGLLFDGHR